MRTPASDNFFRLILSISKARRFAASAGSFFCSSRFRVRSCASRRQTLLEERRVDEGRLVREREHRLLAGERRDHGDVAGLELGDEVVLDHGISHIVGEDIHALVDDHLGILVLEGMRHGDLAVHARLVEHRGAEFARELRELAVLRVDPDLHEVGAVGDDLVDLGAPLLRRPGLRAGDEGRRHEAVFHCEDAGAAQIAGALRRLERDDVVLVEIHAGRRRDAVEHVLPQLRIARRRPDMAVGIDDAGHHELTRCVDHCGAGGNRHLRRRADGGDAATFHDDGDVALGRGAGPVDQVRVDDGGLCRGARTEHRSKRDHQESYSHDALPCPGAICAWWPARPACSCGILLIIAPLACVDAGFISPATSEASHA
jgi:hypothetical protein